MPTPKRPGPRRRRRATTSWRTCLPGPPGRGRGHARAAGHDGTKPACPVAYTPECQLRRRLTASHLFAHAARAAGPCCGQGGGRRACSSDTSLCVQAQVLVPQCPGLRGVRFGAHPALRGSALPSLATVSPTWPAGADRDSPPSNPTHSPTTTSTADEHAALACAGWPVRPQSKMPWTTCAPSSSRTKQSQRAFHRRRVLGAG